MAYSRDISSVSLFRAPGEPIRIQRGQEMPGFGVSGHIRATVAFSNYPFLGPIPLTQTGHIMTDPLPVGFPADTPRGVAVPVAPAPRSGGAEEPVTGHDHPLARRPGTDVGRAAEWGSR